MNQNTIQVAKKLCRGLRQSATQSEQLFWNEVRNKKILGVKFYRQHPLFFVRDGKSSFFIADFYSFKPKLVIEIDGINHDYQKDYDEMRTYMINTLGISVVRFKNSDIETDLQQVIKRLKEILNASK